MKTRFKLLILLSAILSFFTLSSFFTQQSGNKYLTIRTIEVINGIWDSKIVIMFEDGKVEEIELEKFRSRNFTDNSKKIHDALNYVAGKGYTLISSSSGNGDAVIITSFIFTKN